jgi:hypothetical protein
MAFRASVTKGINLELFLPNFQVIECATGMLLQLEVLHREQDSMPVSCFDDPNALLFIRIISRIIWRFNNAVRFRVTTAARFRHVHKNIRSDESVLRDTRIGMKQYSERASLRHYVERFIGTTISKTYSYKNILERSFTEIV